MRETGRILEAVRALETLAHESSSHAEQGAGVAQTLGEEAQLLEDTVKALHRLAR